MELGFKGKVEDCSEEKVVMVVVAVTALSSGCLGH